MRRAHSFPGKGLVDLSVRGRSLVKNRLEGPSCLPVSKGTRCYRLSAGIWPSCKYPAAIDHHPKWRPFKFSGGESADLYQLGAAFVSNPATIWTLTQELSHFSGSETLGEDFLHCLHGGQTLHCVYFWWYVGDHSGKWPSISVVSPLVRHYPSNRDHYLVV